MLGKCFFQPTVQHGIHTNLLDLDTKRRIDKLDEKLEKWLDDMNFVNGVGEIL